MTDLESRVDRYFTRLVRTALGGITVKISPTTVGVPDRLVLLPEGRIFLVELKRSGGETTPKQDHWHGLARALGTTVYVLHGTAEVDQWVAERKNDG